MERQDTLPSQALGFSDSDSVTSQNPFGFSQETLTQLFKTTETLAREVNKNDPFLCDVSNVAICPAPEEFTAIVSKSDDITPHEVNIRTESIIFTQNEEGQVLPQRIPSGTSEFSFGPQLMPTRSFSDYFAVPNAEYRQHVEDLKDNKSTLPTTVANELDKLKVSKSPGAATAVVVTAEEQTCATTMVASGPQPHHQQLPQMQQVYQQIPQFYVYPSYGAAFTTPQLVGPVIQQSTAVVHSNQPVVCQASFYGSSVVGGINLMSANQKNELGRPTDNASPQGALAPPAISPVTPTGAVNDIPSNVPYPGQCSFEIFFTKAKEVESKKTISYTFSTECNKLYVRQSAVCPVHFKVSKKPPAPSLIRAMAIYSRPADIGDVVKRCMNHTMDDSHMAPAHLIRTTHPHGSYYEDPATSRHSVLIPWEEPSPGSEYITGMYQFMCFSSCSGTINRRPMQIIFTLEHNGIVIGRQVVELRICACPGRDRQNDEEQANPQKRKQQNKVEKTCTITTVEPLAKKQKPNNANDEIYTLEIRGRELYKLVTTIVQNYQLAQNYTDLVAAAQRALMPANPSQQQQQLLQQQLQEPLGKLASRKIAQDLTTSETSIANWLESIEMNQYVRKFYDNNFKTMAQTDSITETTLDKIGVALDDRDRLMASLLHYRAAQASSRLSSLSTPPNSMPNQMKVSRTTITHSYKLHKKLKAGQVEPESDN